MAEFDAVASTYEQQHARSIRLTGEDTSFFAQYKIIETRKIVYHRNLRVHRILDFGSGIGNSLESLRACFPDAAITCLDVSEQSLEHCRARAVGNVDYQIYDGETLPSNLGEFDLIFTACVFHHIPETHHVSLLGQLRQNLAPEGLFVLFEHNPWNPLTRHAVANCPFDENAVLISASAMNQRLKQAGFASPDIRFRVFFPKVLASLRRFEQFLGRVPFGGQYSIAANR